MSKKKLPHIINIKDTVGVERYDDVFREYVPETVTDFKHMPDQNGATVLFKTASGVQLKVCFLTDSIVRFSYTYQRSYMKDPLYALSDKAKEILTQGNPLLTIETKIHDDHFTFETTEIKVHISKHDLKLSIYYRENQHFTHKIKFSCKLISLFETASPLNHRNNLGA